MVFGYFSQCYLPRRCVRNRRKRPVLALKLEATDINALMHLLSFWWAPESLPHLSKQAIATRMGVAARTVQRRTAAMEELSYIERVRRKSEHRGTQTTIDKFDDLIRAATVFAKKHLEEREAKVAADRAKAKRLKPGKPKLSVVT